MARKKALATTAPAIPDTRVGMAESIAKLGAQALAIAGSWVIESATDAERIGETLRSWGQNVKLIDDEKEIDTRTLADDLARRRKRWNGARSPWQQAIDLGKGIVDAWRNASRERAMAALPAATSPAETQAVVDVLVAKPMRTVKHYSVRVVNENLVARRWWAFKQAEADAYARAVKEAFDEPGMQLVVEERSTLG